MKIIGLSIVNARRIKAIELQLKERGLIPITGKNRQGKTTILDSIEAVFLGKKSITKNMVREGEKYAEIKLHLEDGEKEYLVKRRISKGGRSTIEIRNQDGMKMDTKPETFLRGLVNALSFDPKPFLDKSDKDKLEFLIELLNIDVSKFDVKIKELEQERLFVGRELKKIGEPKEVEPADEVDINKIYEQRDQETASYYQAKAEYDEQVLEQQKIASEYEKAQTLLKSLEEQKKQLEKQLKEVKQRIAKGKKVLKEMPKPVKIEPLKIDIKEILEKYDKLIKEAQEKNRQAIQYKEYLEHKKRYNDKQVQYKQLDAQIKNFRTDKQEYLSKIDMPVKGLEIVLDDVNREDGIYYNGIRSSEWSSSEALRISLELSQAMKPKLNAVFIDEGEKFDKESLQELDKWAKENDIQAVITIVRDEKEGEDVFYIEDGILIE